MGPVHLVPSVDLTTNVHTVTEWDIQQILVIRRKEKIEPPTIKRKIREGERVKIPIIIGRRFTFFTKHIFVTLSFITYFKLFKNRTDEEKEETILDCIPNYDLTNIVTQVDVDMLEQLLLEAKYELEETRFIVNGFRFGFPLGDQGPQDRKTKARNLPLRCGSKVIFWNKMISEVNTKRLAGPYDEIPCNCYIQSPAGLVLKQNNDTRLIFHLSWPENASVYYYTPSELCSVKYNDLDNVFRLLMKTGKGCYMAKSDMKAAFRNLPIRRSDWKWMVLMVHHPITNKKQYFINKNMVFGSSISCSHFQRFSNAVQAIFEYRKRSTANNYLDDFLFMALLEGQCDCLVNQIIAIPVEKRNKVLKLLLEMMNSKKTTVLQLQHWQVY